MIAFLRLDSLRHGLNLSAGNIPALDTLRRSIHRQQHVTLADKVFGPALVHNHLGVCLRLGLEGDTHGEIGLDHS